MSDERKHLGLRSVRARANSFSCCDISAGSLPPQIYLSGSCIEDYSFGAATRDWRVQACHLHGPALLALFALRLWSEPPRQLCLPRSYLKHRLRNIQTRIHNLQPLFQFTTRSFRPLHCSFCLVRTSILSISHVTLIELQS